MKAQGTSVYYTYSARKINLSLIRSGKVKSKPMRNFLQDAEATREVPGQTVLKAVIYSELLGNKPTTGPPCLFKYLSTAGLNKVKDELRSELWYNGCDCTPQNSSDDGTDNYPRHHMSPLAELPLS